MATSYKTPVEKRQKLVAKPRPDLDVEAVRESIDKRYANTLRYLGR